MENLHTPGPWTAGSDDDCQAITSSLSENVIARVLSGSISFDEAAANQLLIAAAPDLLASLIAAYDWIDRAEQEFINGRAKGKDIQKDLGAGALADLDQKISAAIAKARGGA